MNYLKFVPLSLFSVAIGKALYLSPSWSDVAVITVLGLLSIAFEVFSQNKQMQVLHKRCETIDKILTDLAKENEARKSDISGLRVGSLRFQNLTNTKI